MRYSEMNFCILAVSLTRRVVTNLPWGTILGIWGRSPQPPKAGVLGQLPQPPEARDPGAEAPALGDFAIFFFQK